MFSDKNAQQALLDKGRTSDEIVELSIKVYYKLTPNFEKTVNGKTLETINSYIDYLNTGAKNSGVKIHFNLHCVEKYGKNYHPNIDQNSLLYDFRTSKGNDKHTLGSADMALILVKDDLVVGKSFAVSGAAYIGNQSF